MIKALCDRIRSQLFFYIDNELKEEKRIELTKHLNGCEDCQEYFDKEKELKSKICKKLKDSYFCDCDVERLKNEICNKISKIQDISN